jgi:hypothetical protein
MYRSLHKGSESQLLIRDIIDSLVKEIKCVLKEYAHQTEVAVKKRLKNILITGIIYCVLLALVIFLFGSAVIFLIVGQLKYLSTFMPVWLAWDIMGLIAGVIGAMILLVLYLFIRKQLRSDEPPATTKQI